MKQITQTPKGEIKVDDVPIPVRKPGWILVRNVCSLISVGTERMIVESAKKNLLQKAMERPEQVKQVLENIKEEGIIATYKRVQAKLNTPDPLGYSCAGVVVDIGDEIDVLKVGDRVACAGAGWANHAEYVCVPKNMCVRLPEGVEFEDAAFTTMGAIAFQGVRQAQVSIGENIAVIGLGLLGLLTVQILKCAGCRVFAVDVDEKKVAQAVRLGADMGGIRGKDDIKHMICEFSYGYGTDVVIITAAAPTNDPVVLAGQIARDRAKIVIVGAVHMDIPREDYYKKELSLVLSRSYGPGRYDKMYEEKGIDYPVGYVRWTEQRNMVEFLRLIQQDKISLKELITHRFDIKDAIAAYEVMSKGKEEVTGIIITYGDKDEIDMRIKDRDRVILKDKIRINKDKKPGVGFIGAGSFAQGFLLPYFEKEAELIGVATATGINAKNIAKRFGFKYCTTDSDSIFKDNQIDIIAIATRHNLHAKLVIQGLKKNKVVFTEKPLALSLQELKDIVMAYQQTKGMLMVGFNRRFAPLIVQMKKFFVQNITNGDRLVMHYRVNAGFIPKNSWIQDIEEGGGRIIGEVCHFVDLLQYICNAEPETVYAVSLPVDNANTVADDNLIVTITFRDGSIGSIHYVACGDTSFPKERIEVFGGTAVAVIDNFKKGMFVKGGKTQEHNINKQDKGHKHEVCALINAVKTGKDMPIEFKELVISTLTTFKIIEAIKKRAPVTIDIAEVGM